MKKKILILILILLLIAISLIFIILKFSGDDLMNNSDEGKSDPIIIENAEMIKYPTNRSNYFAVENIVNQYIRNLVNKNEIEYSSNYHIILDKVYMVEENQIIQTYFIDLFYYNKDNGQNYNTNLMVQLDALNQTYQIIPYETMKEKGYDKLELGDYFSSGITSIQSNGNNEYDLEPVSKNSMPEKYLDLYLEYVKYDKEKAYYLLNKEYREKKFGDINNYLVYLSQIDINTIKLDKYKIDNYEEYTQYTCVDNLGNYYIFNEKSVMNYEIVLDTYTVDSSEFINKYNSATNQQKVALNIDKFFQAINAKDYKYAYNCLADSYKNNYFKTQEEFEVYAKENFYESSTVGYNKFNVEGELYTYSVILTNEETGEQMNKTFIMQLVEGTEFVLSFDK